MELIADKPDAIFWSGAYSAEICIAQLMRMGVRVPEDISIIAENSSPPSELSLSTLTVVCSKLGDLFKTAVDFAMNGNIKNHVYRQQFGSQLFIGDTVAIKRP
jgi:DNA-binding LacI/PurR family transcriptional regulator